MGITRTSQSTTTFQRNLCVNRLRLGNVGQVRYLWWWGKQNRGGWFRSQHQQYEDLAERLRRHQNLMMHRYSKVMKRRALWDRDTNPSSSSWYYQSSQWGRDMSSTEPKKAKVEGEENNTKTHREQWHEFHKDFESFKAAVDRAIERNPYGTLFGRRLRSPDTSKSTSWTSWSWIFDPKEIKEDPVLEPEKEKKSPTLINESRKSDTQPFQDSSSPSSPSSDFQRTSSKTESITISSSSIVYADPPLTSAAGQYVYDPISGRKVLQSPPVASPPKAENNAKQNDDATCTQPPGGFLRSLFATEHGVDIPVKTYKPPKIYGYNGTTEAKKQDPTTEAKAPAEKRFESSRKREYNQLRASTLGNSIDTTAEFGGKFVSEAEQSEAAQDNATAQTEQVEASEKRVRTSPPPAEDTPLFTGTTYALRSDQPSQASDWLINEGFRAKQGMTMSSLKNGRPTQTISSEKFERIQPALDRTSSSAADISVKKFSPKMQPSIDRVITPALKENLPMKKSSSLSESSEALKAEQPDRREDMDLLRASDVRAAAKSARVTKQAIEDRKKKERSELEKDFAVRQAENQSVPEPGVKKIDSLSGALGNIWKHVKQYPTGIVAKTMQSVGLVPTSNDVRQSEKPTKPATTITEPATNAVNPIQQSDEQLRTLASDLKGIFDEYSSTAGTDVSKIAQSTSTPAFTQPTVRPGVIRNLEIERHTKLFEPALADIVDKAKAIKRELHDVSRSLGGFANERAISAIAERQVLQSKLKATDDVSALEASKSASSLGGSVEISSAIATDSPFILLTYNNTTDDVNATSLNSLVGKSGMSEVKQNTMAAIGSLNHPSAFVKHFATLDNNGYELKGGGGDVLVFQKIQVANEGVGSTISNIPSTSVLRNTIAAAEAAAQPQSVSPKTSSETIKTANVLDEIPSTIPIPGPSAPTAPQPSSIRIDQKSQSPEADTVRPTTQTESIVKSEAQTAPSSDQSSRITAQHHSLRQRKPRSQIRRQEEVFSGQQRLAPQITSLPDVTHFQKQNPVMASFGQSATFEDQPSLFARFRRAVKRVVLTALAFGVGAYSIGVVAEGIASKAQIEGRGDGPMKRLVLEAYEGNKSADRQRAGIFSTESSR